MKKAGSLCMVIALFFGLFSIAMAAEMTKESRLGPQTTMFPDPEAVEPPKTAERKPKLAEEEPIKGPYEREMKDIERDTKPGE